MWNVDANAGRALLDELAAARRTSRKAGPVSQVLPHLVRNKAKAPEFVQAGIDVIVSYADLDEAERNQRWSWMQQQIHDAPDNGSPHSYFYHATEPRDAMTGPGRLALASQGPPYVYSIDNNPLRPDSLVVVASSVTDKFTNAAGDTIHGTKRRGRSFRIARITRSSLDGVRPRDLSSRDIAYTESFQFVHVGVDKPIANGGPVLPPCPPANLPSPSGDGLEMPAHYNPSSSGLGDNDFDYPYELDADDVADMMDDAELSRINEVESAVYDDHEPRMLALEASQRELGQALQTLQVDGRGQIDHQEPSPEPLGASTSSASRDHATRPASAQGRPLKEQVYAAVVRMGREVEKLEVRRELKEQTGDEVRVKDVNRALYELKSEGRVREVGESGNRPLWRAA